MNDATRADWTIVENEFSARTNLAFEGMATLGSGYLHVRSSLEEALEDDPQNLDFMRMPANVTAEKFRRQKSKWGAYVPGVYGKHPTLNHEIVNVPRFIGVEPEIDGERLSMESSRVSDYRRALRMDVASLERSFVWKTESAAAVRTTFERFASGARKKIVAQRMTMTTDAKATLRLVSGVDADVRTNGYNHFEHIALAIKRDHSIECKATTDLNEDVSIVAKLFVEGGDWRRRESSRRAELEGEFELRPGETFVFEKRSAVSTSRDLDDLSALDALAEVEGATYDELFEEHAAVWKARWEAADVEIDADDEKSQLATRLSIYHLLRAHVEDDPRVAIDAKGYAGDAYWGRFFWDTEVYLLPFYAHVDPKRAKTLVDFRVRALAGAKQNAKQYGYNGARFPWESDPRGLEMCPNWHYADHETHVTADVVFGFQYYAAATGEDDYPASEAAETIVETARYWLERIDYLEGDDKPSILGVMGPDEYKPIVDNNFYTNLIVAYAMQIAARVGEKGGASAEEVKEFERVSRELETLKCADGLHLQCEGFDRLPDPQFDLLWKNRDKPFAAQVSQERIYRTKCLKQADVLMGMFLFPTRYSEEEIRRAYDYYVPLTTHDSSLSAGVHAIVANWLGYEEDAWNFWKSASTIDLDGGAEQGVHIAGAGAVWMIVAYGFAGMRSPIESERPAFRPRFPKNVARVKLPIMFRGASLTFEATAEEAKIENRGDDPVEVAVFDEVRTIKPKQTETFSIKG
jgi:trehalose/maltose hydrolase-like predicted phosphorylase